MITHDIFYEMCRDSNSFCARHEANLNGNLHGINQPKWRLSQCQDPRVKPAGEMPDGGLAWWDARTAHSGGCSAVPASLSLAWPRAAVASADSHAQQQSASRHRCATRPDFAV